MTTPTLLLIHGLGATSGVWTDVVRKTEWPGPVIVPDLPGHGRGAATGDYTIGALAAAVGAAVEDPTEVIAVGHSLGGCVALCLASGFFRPVVRAAIGVGMKLVWTAEDVETMAQVASRGARLFDTRTEAVERFLRVAGLVGIVGSDHPAVEHAVIAVDGRWRVAQDPATFAQRPVDGPGLVAAARCPVIIGAGEHDPMVGYDDMAALVAEPRIAPGRGHNVHVEDPAWVASLIHGASAQLSA